ncbi:hypothetical protein ACFL20_12045 [Spirochaetota bacterium]
MEILVFSNNKNIDKSFTGIKRSKDHSICYFSCSDLNKEVKKAAKGSLLYFDISGQTPANIKKALNSLSKLKEYRYGVIDSKGALKDVAELFQDGAVDYIGKELIKTGIPAKRLQKVLRFRSDDFGGNDSEEGDASARKDYILTGNDWKGIRSGKEYTFCFMFIELDNKKEIKASGPKKTQEFMQNFHDVIEDWVYDINGKIWMWMDFGGLILIPFDGKKCEAILSCFRLMIARKIISFEDFDNNMLLNFRIALHIGNTIYKERGDTGSIVSDSINSIFHLGQKFAEPGTFNLTEDIVKFIPKELYNYFSIFAEYEGRNIYKMKKLL